MVVRAPVLAYVIWLTTMFSPFAVVAIPLALNLHVMFIGVTIMLASMASWYIYAAFFRNTRRRILQSLIRSKARGEDKPFVLISRSYDQSGVFLTGASIPMPGVPVAYLTLFEALIYDLSHDYPIVVLGDKDLHPDDPAGRALYMSAWPNNSDQLKSIVFNVQTGELIVGSTVSWEEIFVRLAHAARFVLVIPAPSEGVRREITMLKEENLGSKTVVYMWPEQGAHPNRAISATGQAWEALRESVAAHGLALPPHCAQGALLRLNDDFTIRATYELPRRDLLTPVAADDDDRDLTPLREIVPVIEAYEIAANADRYVPMWGYPERNSEFS